MFSKIPPGEDESKLSKFFSPGHVDQFIRQAIDMCWMMLPEDKRTVDEVEKQIRRVMERAIKNIREDGEAFRKKS